MTTYLFILLPLPRPQEIELQARRDQFRVEEVRQGQILQKRQIPKKLKTEHKAAVAELRKAIRQKKVGVSQKGEGE